MAQPVPSSDLAAKGRETTVLLGWELGGGLGHAGPLLSLARALATKGCRPVLVWRDVVQPWSLLRGESFPVFQAPFWQPRPSPQPFQAAGYADILAVNGYGSADDLRPLVEAWQAILNEVRPALVVCDHAPTLCLAAYGAIPTVLLGSGFILPPSEGERFPLLASGHPPTMSEEEVLANVREVQRHRDRPAPATLPALFAAAERFVTCLSEIDPYSDSRREPHLGPLEGLPEPAPLPDRPSYFAYLSAHYGLVETVLDRLSQPGYTGTAYVRGATAAQRQRWRRSGLTILDAPQPLADVVLPAAVVVLHGTTVMQFALAAGRPQLLFPEHLEQALAALHMHRLGVAHYLHAPYPIEDIAEGLRQLMTRYEFRERAQQTARAIHARGPWNALERIADRCLALLASPN